MEAKLGRLSLGDFERGLIMAVLGAFLGVVYETLTKGIPQTSLAWRNLGFTAGGAALTAGVAYLLKNLGTNSEGKILKAEPRGEVK